MAKSSSTVDSEGIQSVHFYVLYHIKELKNRFPSIFSRDASLGMKTVIELARLLDVTIKIEDNPFLEGYIKIKNKRGIIILNKNLHSKKKLKIVLHEIGHWMLHTYNPELTDLTSIEWKEEHANKFAEEMLRMTRGKDNLKIDNLIKLL